MDEQVMEKQVRAILQEHSGLGDHIRSIGAYDSLWQMGMTSLASVQVMLALESAFGLEFPDSKLRHNTFACISNIIDCVDELTGSSGA
jgi:acyl carrier protein